MGKRKAARPTIDLAVRGAVIPDGSGRVARADVHLGDGFPPCILIQLGTDASGAVVAQVTAGGMAELGSMEKNLTGVGALLAQIGEIMMEEVPLDGE